MAKVRNNKKETLLIPLLQDYVVMCIDVGPMMTMTPPSRGDTPLDLSLKIAGQIVAQKACVNYTAELHANV